MTRKLLQDGWKDLSKIEAGQVKIKPEVFNLNLLFENIYMNFQQQNNKGLLFLSNKGLSDGESFIIADKTRLNQVLSNLLNNAMKFTMKGHIIFSYNVVDKQIVFSVEDTGIGISYEYQEKVFERFRQADPETTRVFGGTGLGLSISQRLVELMGGKIWLQSVPGKGSIFYFTIPYVSPELSTNEYLQLEKENDQDKLRSSRPLILIAEDEESNFIYLDEILQEQDFRILWAKNGRQAYEFCMENNQIRLVLMDIKMPGMDGYKATELIKKKIPNLPIIAQTAFAMVSDKESALAKGCDDYLSKPIDPSLLLEKIKKYIG